MAKEFTYKMNIDAEIGGLTTKLKTVKDALASVTNEGKEPKLAKILDSLASKLDGLKTKASTPIRSEAAFGSMEKDIQSIDRLLENLSGELSALSKKLAAEKISFLPPGEQKRLLALVAAMQNYDKAIDATTKKSKELVAAEREEQKAKGNLEKINAKLAANKDALATAQFARKNAEAALAEANARQEAAKAAEEQYARIQKLASAAKAADSSVDLRKATFDDGEGNDITLAKARANRDKAAAAAAADDLGVLRDALNQTKGAADNASAAIGRAETAVIKQTAAVQAASATVKDLTGAYEASKITDAANAFAEFRRAAQDLGVSLDGIGADNAIENVNALKERINECVETGVAPANEAIHTSIEAQGELVIQTEKTSDAIGKNVEQFRAENEQAGQVDGIMSRIKQFTGLTGVALVMRRALQSAINTTKELDKQMTAMAVVTDLEVGDYWKQLPEHTEQANKLGVAIKDVYEAETLYYQQGLKTAQVQKLSTSTLKMARIAGLSAEDATNKMTAALRGFNMEINETNADRIADVYSKLAAITASDVQEISTAMTKTASLASNAGMEFETTAAFLAQIIETTRESAETAGTALKTVIARFQELKKSPDEIGEVDGEIVDANKIETALRSVDVALRDTQGQFRDLDDVFMDLSAKWDSLDTNTQRYIATIAAGSRQQSRFIAMMSDYSRTSELVNAANNAAGASNEQFEKTLESLQSKLAQLKNAWDTFTQGLANNELIKFAVDLLTGLMTAVNKVTQGFGPWSSSALKIGMVTAALIAGDKAIRIFTQSLKGGSSVLGAFGNIFKTAGLSVKDFALRLMTQAKAMKTHNAITTKGIEAINARRNAEKALSNANATVAAHEKTIADLRAKSNVVTDAQVQEETKLKIAKEQQAAASEGVAKAQEEEALALGLSATQQEVYNTMVGAGVTEETAAILAKAGLTTASWANMQAAYGEAAATHASELAQKLQNAGLIKGTIIKWNDQIATIAQAAANGTYTGSAITATVAQWAMNIAVWAGCPPLAALALIILVVVAAIALLVVAIIGIIALFKALKANTPEGKLKAANEAFEQASKVADQAKESYNNLKDSLTELNDKYDALDDMVVGTQEWRDALLEVNEQVMDLINEYPELADAVQVDANGVMRIGEEGQQQLLQEKQAVNARAQSAKLTAQMAKNQAQANLDYSNLSDKAIAGNQARDTWAGMGTGAAMGAATMGAATYGIGTVAGAIYGAVGGGVLAHAASRENNRNLTEDLAKALGENRIQYLNGEGGIDKEALKEYMTSSTGLGMIPEVAQEWLDDLDEATLDKLKEYGQTLNANAKAQEAAMQAMISNAMTMVDTNNYTNEQLKQMNNIGTQLVSDTLDITTESIKSLSDEDYKKRAEEYYSEFGEDVEIDKKGNVTYKDQEGNEVNLTKDQVEAQLAGAEATNEMQNKLELLPKALDKALTTAGGKALNKAYNDKEGMGLSRSDLADLSGEALKRLYEGNAELQEIYGDFEKFQEEMTKRTTLATQAFKQNADHMARIGMEGFKFDQTLTAEAEKGLVNKLEEVVAVSGPQTAAVLGNQINSILGHVAEEDRDALVAQFNAIDWHDADALERLPATLKELGYNLPTKDLENFVASAKEATHAIHNIDMEKLNEGLLELTQILDGMRTNDQGRTFESDVYDKLIAADGSLASSFVQNLDGSYTYLGTSMSELKEAVLANTEALVEEEKIRLNAAMGVRTTLDTMAKAGPGSDIEKMSTRSADDQRAFLKQLISTASAADLNALGIDYLSSSTKVDRITDDKIIKQIINDLKGLGTRESIQAQLDASVRKALTTSNLDQDAYFNTRTEASRQAVRGKGTATSTIEYQAERRALLSQAQAVGISEKDYETLLKYNKELQTMEEAGRTNTMTYRRLANETNKLMRTLATKTSFETMYKGMEKNVGKSYELLQAFQSTTNAMQKQQIVSEMMSEFQLKVTKNNYDQLAQLTDAYLHGNYEGFIRIIQLSGEAAGVMGDAYNDLNEQLMTDIEAMGEDAYDFAIRMVDAGYARIDAAQNRFYWGQAELNEIVKDTVDELDRWLDPYNWLYNQNNLINAQIRERERLERKYNMALEDGNATVKELSENLAAQAASIRENSAMQKNVYEQADKELRAYVKYFNETQNFEPMRNVLGIGANGGLVVDKEKLYQAKLSADAGSVVESEIGKIEELIDTMRSAEDALQDNEDALRELGQTGKNEYMSGLDRVTEGLRITYQREIDKLSAINDSINDAQSKLADKIQEKIDDDRQARAEEKARENLTDKSTQLAYLQASGGSQLDILKMQKDLNNDQEAYTDSLVDKSLKEMQDANQKAADQRQEQIDIAQAQYDFWSEYEAVHDAEEILNNSLKDIADGLSPDKTGVGELLYGTENVAAQSKEGIEDWYKELGNTANLAAIHAGLVGTGGVTGAVTTFKNSLTTAQEDTTTAVKAVETAQQTYSVGRTSLVTDTSQVKVSAADIANNTDEWARQLAGIKTKVTEIEIPPEPIKVEIDEEDNTPDVPTLSKQEAQNAGAYFSSSSLLSAVGQLREDVEVGSSADVQAHLFRFGDETYYHNEADDAYYSTDALFWDEKLKQFMLRSDAYAYKMRKAIAPMVPYLDFFEDIRPVGGNGGRRGPHAVLKYDTGGLADFTGPAWLDGTKSSPEMVLNQTDTVNFIELKNVLADLLKNNNGNSTGMGNNYYDIDVHVDSIESDYDIDSAAARMRELIEDDAMYRNVNAIQQIR